MVNPIALYDAIVLADRICQRIGSVVGPEIHLFSYLACLLAVYRGWPPTDWGYRFACTENGAPYSHDIQYATEELLSLGHLSISGEAMLLTQDGKDIESFLSSLVTQRKRLPYLDGATASLLGMSVGVVRYAVSQEPTIKQAVALFRNQLLLDDINQQLIYEEFDKITTAIGTDAPDLMVPAVIWLTALAEASRNSEEL
jgi:hypothetical protein